MTSNDARHYERIKDMSAKVTEIVTKIIIEKLEQGIIPWKKPWTDKSERPCNYFSKRPYSGFNMFLLSCLGYERPYFVTAKAVNKAGGRVKYDEFKKGIPVVFWAFDDEINPLTNKKIQKFKGMRFYTVYHISQCEGMEFKLPEIEVKDVQPIELCENVVNGYGLKAQMGYDRACYIPSMDIIQMPNITSFIDSEHYYRTYFHEMVHSTGHDSRLKRELSNGKESYAKEELIAELGAAMLCAQCGIKNHIDNSAAYIALWLKALKNDRSLIIGASSKAEKAYDYILQGSSVDNPVEAEETEVENVSSLKS